jgi:hypothetical protein
MLAPEDLRNVDRTRAGGVPVCMPRPEGDRQGPAVLWHAMAKGNWSRRAREGCLPAPAEDYAKKQREQLGHVRDTRGARRKESLRSAAVGRLPETGVQVSFVVLGGAAAAKREAGPGPRSAPHTHRRSVPPRPCRV